LATRRSNYLSFILGAFVKGLVGLIFVTVLGFAAVFALALAAYDSYAKTLVPPDQLSINRPSAGAKILDRNGKLLYQYVDDTDGMRKPVKLDEVSPAFLAATIATEDRNFFDNPGVNPRGLVRATWENFNPMNDESGLLKGTGGSSITQQLVKNVYIPQNKRFLRSIDRKAREIVYAVELTKRYDKSQILEWYVNQISYGSIYTGVEAASEGYFGKPAKDLTLAEATLLAGIPQSPAAYDPLTNLPASLERRNEVLDAMLRQPSIQIGADLFYTPNPEEVEAARGVPVEVHAPVFNIEAPHFVLNYVTPQLEQVIGRDALLHDGLIVTTTLDIDLQNRAQKILESRITEFEKISNTHNGAVMVMDPRSGEVLVMLGSRDYFRDDIDGQVNNTLAPNSPGSTFKPFVYLTTFQKLGWNPGTIIQDSPVSFRESDGTVFSPTNPNKGYNGNITIRNALGNSLNVPAFKAAIQVGVPNIVAFGKSVGFTGLDGSYGPSIAIGGIDLKLIDLTYGYSTIGNGGYIAGQNTLAPRKPDESGIRPVPILSIADSTGRVVWDINEHRAGLQVIRPEHAYMIADILSDSRAQCITFGCGGITVPGYRVGVKTGTSEPFDPKGPNRGKIGETWAFGFTPDYAVGIWAGNSNNAPIDNIFSTSISYRAMRDILLTAYSGRPETPFQQPSGLVSRQSCTTPAAPPWDPFSGQPPPPPPAPVCTTELSLR
jgi:membrane peptidoglycan carboxypeptidase